MNYSAAGSTLLFALALLLAGCATPSPYVVSERVGSELRTETASEPRGTLVVYSAWDIYPGGESDNRYREDYVLQWPEARVQKVRNHVGTFDEGPVAVSLPPGTYQVKARAIGHGRVTASVVIEAGRTTSLWLDGSMPKEATNSAAGLIRLPGGQIIGWKSAH